MAQQTYVAFLRGINVGKRQIKMAELRTTLEGMGFKNVRTLLASGNALFETTEQDPKKLVQAIEARLKETFGFEIGVILRTIPQIQALWDAQPFAGVMVTPETRLYITFLAEKPASRLEIPYETPEKDFRIVQVTEGEVCSVLTLSEQRGTVDAMAIIEKEYGKKSTTRNWNTVEKVMKG